MGHVPKTDKIKIEADTEWVVSLAQTQTTFRSVPSGAHFKLVGRSEAGSTPLTIPGLPFDETIRARFQKEGYAALTQEFQVLGRSELAVTLIPEKNLPTGNTPKPQKRPIANSGEKGRLKVLVEPWADVFIDGKSYGSTPMAPLHLKPGTYTVKLTNKSLKKEEESKITIRSGKTITLRKKW